MESKFFDTEEFLSREDISELYERLRKRMVVWVCIGCLLTAISISVDSPAFTDTDKVICLIIWLGIILFNFFELYMAIRRNRKIVVRGRIAARYEKDQPTRRYGQSSHFFVVNGRELGVPRKIYQKYLIEDIAEFHHIGKIFLKDELLGRSPMIDN